MLQNDDFLLVYAGSEQLAAVCLDKVEMEFGRRFSVPRCARVEEEQRIFFADGIGRIEFLE